MSGDEYNVEVTAESDVIRYHIRLSVERANKLYNELTILLRDRGVDIARDRHKLSVPAIYDVYDLLYEAGVDGSS